jgi:hypothetical protein
MSSSVCSVRAPIVVWRLFVPVIALFIVLVAALVGPGTAVATALGAPGGLYFTGALGFPAWLDQLSAMALGESPAVGTLTSGQVLTSLGLTVDPGQTGTGQTFTATVIALDQFGNEMVTMPPGGQVVNITIDGGATGPTQVTMLSGVSTFDITAVTEGQVTVTVNSGLMVSTAAVRVSNNAGTVVPGGNMVVDTVWTAAGSPYLSDHPAWGKRHRDRYRRPRRRRGRDQDRTHCQFGRDSRRSGDYRQPRDLHGVDSGPGKRLDGGAGTLRLRGWVYPAHSGRCGYADRLQDARS